MAYMLHANVAYETRHSSTYTGSILFLFYTDHIHVQQNMKEKCGKI